MQRQRSNEICLRKWRKTPETMSVWKTQRVVHWGSSGQPPSSPIHSDSLTQCIVAYTAMSYHSARTQSKVNKGKGTWGEAGEKADESFQGSSPSGVTQAPLHPPRNVLWQHLWSCKPRKFAETQHLGFLLGAGHTGTLCLPCTNITHSHRETSLQHKPSCSPSICKWAIPPSSGNGELCSKI